MATAAAAAAVGIGVGLSLSVTMENSAEHSMLNWPGNPSPLWASLSLTNVAEGTLVEPKTGVEFPAVLDGTRRLLGVGLRRKSLFGLKNIDVYAFGSLLFFISLFSFCFLYFRLASRKTLACADLMINWPHILSFLTKT